MTHLHPDASALRGVGWTSGFQAASGSAVDPLAEEVTWRAWEVTAADPSHVDDHALRSVTGSFDAMVETAWRPGRSIIISETQWQPAGAHLSVRLAQATLGERGTTAADADALAGCIDGLLDRGPFAARAVHPSTIVPAASTHPHPVTTPPAHSALLRQRLWTVGDSEDLVEVVSRFWPTVEPWAPVAHICVRYNKPIAVRATVLATELSPMDRIELEHALDGVRRLRDRNPDRVDIGFDAARAEATLLDLRASFATPLLVCEILIRSPEPLPETLLRAVAAAFTSESDVLRQQGRVIVAANRLVLGGYQIERDVPGSDQAFRAGLPLRGGLLPRQLRDVITLAESPIGWPVPLGAPLPSLPAYLPSRRAQKTPHNAADGPSTPLGRDPAGQVVHHPLAERTRHIAILGTWGAGKSSAMFHLALDDLRSRRPFVFIDPHGTTADLLAGWAASLDVQPIVIDAADGNSARIRVLERLDSSQRRRDRLEAQARRLGDAIASSLPNREWTGPRFFTTWNAFCEVIAAHRAELIDGATWATDPQTLQRALRHPAISPTARGVLDNLTRTNDGRDVLGWVTSKTHPLLSGAARRVIAPAGTGTDLHTAIQRGTPIIVNLAAMAPGEGSFLGHLILDTALAASIDRPHPERILTLYVDEAHRFPANGLAAVIAEGRKFGVSLTIAAQSISQLPGHLADLISAAGTLLAFRSTPDTAARLSAITDVPAPELARLPDLHYLLMLRGRPPIAATLDPFQSPPTPHTKRAPRRLTPNPTTKPPPDHQSNTTKPRETNGRPQQPSALTTPPMAGTDPDQHADSHHPTLLAEWLHHKAISD